LFVVPEFQCFNVADYCEVRLLRMMLKAVATSIIVLYKNHSLFERLQR